MVANVLIVDDSDFMRGLLEEAVSPEHTVIGTAEDGDQAVEAWERAAPDVIMMDIVMPNCDGIQATRTIKQRVEKTKIIMCTSVGQEAKVKEAARAGADGYITKPFEDEQIRAAIRDVLS